MKSNCRISWTDGTTTEHTRTMGDTIRALELLDHQNPGVDPPTTVAMTTVAWFAWARETGLRHYALLTPAELVEQVRNDFDLMVSVRYPELEDIAPEA
ncbi:MAG: hypothetical protein GY929_09015 [Actinomycetia bacterium]|nr:hypothetical protein [Actinomycetes bacterium]